MKRLILPSFLAIASGAAIFSSSCSTVPDTGRRQITLYEAALAAVVGHEIAHVMAKHGGERMSQQIVAAGIGVGIGSRHRICQARSPRKKSASIGEICG